MTEAIRERLPVERSGVTHRFEIEGHKGYLTVSMRTDGRPGEIFIKMSKVGSTVNGLVDSFAIAFSMGLQHGVPLQNLIENFLNKRFEPMGRTKNPQIPHAASIVDYVVKFLGYKFIPRFAPQKDGFP